MSYDDSMASSRPSRRQQEKAPEGRPPHGQQSSNTVGQAPSEHDERGSMPKNGEAGPAPVESKFNEDTE